jgi:hypothetical protein
MAYTTEQIANLKAALATGALKVRFADGRETTFRSLKEMKEIISDAEGEVAAGNGEKPIRFSLARFDSGF